MTATDPDRDPTAAGDPEGTVPSLSPAELDDRLRGRDPLRVLDVRDRDEFEEWHVSGPAVAATQVPHVRFVAAEAKGSVAAVADEVGLDPGDGPVLVVCGHGEASDHVAGLLRAEGYHAYNLAGGMDAWARYYEATETEVETGGDAGAGGKDATTGAAGPTVLQYRRPSSGCLAYLVVSGDEAAVIDPLRAFADRYVDDAVDRGAELVAAVDTHVHADHVSGTREVARKTGAEVVVPEGALDRGLDYVAREFDLRTVADGDELGVGAAALTALAAPGHTTEMTAFRLGDPGLLFAGDSLFVESVARPDLEGGDGAEAAAGGDSARGDDASDLARTLHRTLHEVVLALPDDTRVGPGHYGESAIPAADGSYTARIGDLRDELRALSLDEAVFVEHVVGDLPPRPANYERIIKTNLGRSRVDDDEAFELELGPNNCAATPVS
jgi:glyoxylase-like metal-dependent hydrolase (beta-lactamase superfamily II)